MFEKAIALDPEYAEGYAGIGWTYWMERVWQWSHNSEAQVRALEFAQKAITPNNSLPLAHQLLGQVYLFARKLHEQAMAEGEQAIALDPNDADGYARLSLVLLCMGQPEETIRLIEKAMRLNPRYPAWYLFWLGRAYASAGRLEEAITIQKRAN